MTRLPPMRWTRLYSVGHPTMDAQHQKLFVLVNELIQMQDTDSISQQQAIRETLPKLALYAEKHFHAEEMLMAKAKAEHLDNHRQKHAALLNQVTELQYKVGKGEFPPFQEVLLFLRYWLAEHILVTDKRYAPAMAKLLIENELTNGTQASVEALELW
ncbi:bacteriohemerythrin [Permianibacter aggregans]|uniref:Hemerythrin n=1 Tax=Permianibacter aggregans TaxID=1510150 RepID=A0A4R6UPC3_9GAMM|nr:bacteriohemerythrin [Permianibacter aggregans]QGX38384.1 bacteriohemerythrin [Permianibacter aggregans]TDQ48712.1 hemerythrin [Permianibacter aggregans]